MNELLSTILQAVIIVALPIAVDYAVKLCKARSDKAIAEVEDKHLQSALQEAADAVVTAVTYTAQIYVDDLKKSATFDVTAQKTALATASEKALGLISEPTKKLLVELYGSLEDWVKVKIEQQVKVQKATGAEA